MTYQTRHQVVFGLIRKGECGLLPTDFSVECPRRGGPARPHAQHPGKVGFLTCGGCPHDKGPWYFEHQVCTHPQAHQLATADLRARIEAWERRQRRANSPELAEALARFGTVIGPDEVAEVYRESRRRQAEARHEGPIMVPSLDGGDRPPTKSQGKEEDTMTRDAFDYVPDDVRARIPKLGETDGPSDELGDQIAWLKFFTPESSWTWYVLEFDGEDLCFGLVVGHETELGHFSLSELRDATGPLGLHIERDVWWKPTPLREVSACPPWIKAKARTAPAAEPVSLSLPRSPHRTPAQAGQPEGPAQMTLL